MLFLVLTGILEGVVSTLFDHPNLKHVKKPILVAVVVIARYRKWGS